MNYLFDIFVLLLGVPIFAQDKPSSARANAAYGAVENGRRDIENDGDDNNAGDRRISCYLGEVINGIGSEYAFLGQCAGGEDICHTFIETRSDFFRVVRKCTPLQSCLSSKAGNSANCYADELRDRQCHFCCDENACNTSIEIPEQDVLL